MVERGGVLKGLVVCSCVCECVLSARGGVCVSIVGARHVQCDGVTFPVVCGALGDRKSV